MLAQPQSFIKDFFERNIFERVILYILLSHLLTTIIFQFALGQSYFDQSQNQQWFFYAFLGLDYLLSLRKILNIKITVNPLSMFALFLIVMIGHGLFVGVMNNNPPFVILNDTIPLLMISLNILRMQSLAEISKPISFKFITKAGAVIVGLTCLFSFLAGKAIIGSGALFYPLIFTALIALRPLPWLSMLIFLVATILTLGDTNRTTIMLAAVIMSGYLGVNTIYNPAKSMVLAVVAVLTLFTAWSFLPEDSKTYQRIIGLTEIDLSDRKGSIGERQAENDAIHAKLEKAGKTAQWTGGGFGALYEVRFTHEYIKDYGHAHYAWSWFNLRFGKIGYIYMVILISALIYSGVHNFNRRDDLGLFVAFLCLSGLIYVFTHVNSILLLSGLSFLYVHRERHNKNTGRDDIE